jgi:hypothetical protein
VPGARQIGLKQTLGTVATLLCLRGFDDFSEVWTRPFPVLLFGFAYPIILVWVILQSDFYPSITISLQLFAVKPITSQINSSMLGLD